MPEGLTEASTALGMSWWMTMRRTILPPRPSSSSAGPGAAGGWGASMTAMVVAERVCKDFGALKV